MPASARFGGSLYWFIGVSLTALALGRANEYVSQLRNDRKDRNRLGRFHTSLSAALVKLLVATKPMPFVLIDVRDPNLAETSPLPPELGQVVKLSGHKANAVQSRAMWTLYTPDAQTEYPSYEHLLVFVGSNEKQMLDAAKQAARSGFERTAVLADGVTSLSAFTPETVLPTINQDAVAAVLGHIDAGAVQQALVVDVRRHDELALYGSIPGTVHMPLHQLPAAMEMSSAEWKDAFNFPQPKSDDFIIMHSRAKKRAMWAAQLAVDAGFKHSLVYDKGVNGWHLHSEVKAYSYYNSGDPPHEPETSSFEAANPSTAHAELARLGMIRL